MGRKAHFLVLFSIALVVRDSDGSAFITKAEFDSLQNNFQSQIDSYNSGIDAKIDNSISAYLSGIRISGESTCGLMMPTFDYPVSIIATDSNAIQKNAGSDGKIYYSPKQNVKVILTTGIGGSATGGACEELWYYKFSLPKKQSADFTDMSLYDGTIKTIGGKDVFVVNNLLTKCNIELDMSIDMGGIRAYNAVNGRGFGLALDEYDGTHAAFWEKNKRPSKDNYSRYWKTDKKYEVFAQMYASYLMDKAYDTKRFTNIDQWYDSSNASYRNFKYIPACYKWPDSMVVRYTFTYDKSKNIDVILNDDRCHLPVTYDKETAFSNHKDWRTFVRPWSDASTGYVAQCRYVGEDGAFHTMGPYDSTKTGSNYYACLQAFCNEGYGICAEEHLNTTHTWKDSSLIKASHIFVEYNDNKTFSTETICISHGIPLWHSEYNGDCELKIKIANVDPIHKPNIYIANTELIGDLSSTDPNAFYKISTDKKTYTDFIELVDGENTIHIKDVKKDDKMYFKILHDSNTPLNIVEQPNMKVYIEES